MTFIKGLRVSVVLLKQLHNNKPSSQCNRHRSLHRVGFENIDMKSLRSFIGSDMKTPVELTARSVTIQRLLHALII